MANLQEVLCARLRFNAIQNLQIFDTPSKSQNYSVVRLSLVQLYNEKNGVVHAY